MRQLTPSLAGRKKVLFATYLCLLVASLLSGFANSWILYAVIRFLVGASIGGHYSESSSCHSLTEQHSPCLTYRTDGGQLHPAHRVRGYRVEDILWLRRALGCRSHVATPLGLFDTRLETPIHSYGLRRYTSTRPLVVTSHTSALYAVWLTLTAGDCRWLL